MTTAKEKLKIARNKLKHKMQEYSNITEKEFRNNNKDCFIPKDFSKVHKEYANLSEYLRRWCAIKEKKR